MDNSGNIRSVGETVQTGNVDYSSNTTTTAQTTKDDARGTAKDTSKNNPWVFGLSRSLGGGASVILEHSNVDDDSKKNTTGLFLVVDF